MGVLVHAVPLGVRAVRRRIGAVRPPVAFLGADTNDSPGDAQSFLAQHPVSYPSYQASLDDLHSLAVVQGLPTTIFVDSKGKVAYVHTGQYDSQGTLDSDIQTYAR